MSSDFNRLSSDLLLNVIQFLNVIDGGRLACTSRRMYYLVFHSRRLRGPELATASSYNTTTKRHQTFGAVRQQALGGMACPPNLALLFCQSNRRQEPYHVNMTELRKGLERDFKSPPMILGAVAEDIQVNAPPDIVEHHSRFSLMLGSFDSAVMEPFTFQYGYDNGGDVSEEVNDFCQSHDVEWKAFLVYACGDGMQIVDGVVSLLQAKYPHAAIVGGICESGMVSTRVPKRPKEELSQHGVRSLVKILTQTCDLNQRPCPPTRGLEKNELIDLVWEATEACPPYCLATMEDGVFGMALGGDIPVRSVVSRGVVSLSHRGTPQATTPWAVESAGVVRPGDDHYPDGLPPSMSSTAYHVIRAIYNTETCKSFTPMQFQSNLMAHVHQGFGLLLGIKRPEEDGFELHDVKEFLHIDDQMLLPVEDNEASAYIGAHVDLFYLNGPACVEHVERTMAKLREQTQGEEILGGVMYSCSGRGPDPSYFMNNEPMVDAKTFAQAFPQVPCLGFYAGGEIGPLALAGNKVVFQTGKVALQGFTVVFALFIVPKVEPQFCQLDDCAESVAEFVKTNLMFVAS